MTETFSANDCQHEQDAADPASVSTIASEMPAGEDKPLADLFREVANKDSNRELTLISDNPDGSAEILLVRGSFGMPEAYWFSVNGNVMNARFASLVMSANNLNTDDLRTDEGIYKFMANACGVAACFQSDIPGVSLREAFVGPLDYALYEFVKVRRVSQIESVYIKRSSNTAYKFRKYVTAKNKAAEEAARAEKAEEYVDDEEMTAFFEDLASDE